jgi:hypothetical protein
MVKAYNRRAFTANTKRNMFNVHSFYAYFKNGKIEHTISFTMTPKGSKYKTCYILDKIDDIQSYNSYLSGYNKWHLEEWKNPNGAGKLDFIKTTEKFKDRVEKCYPFFGPAHLRDFPWYHQLWIALAPPPIISLLIFDLYKHSDNCTTCVLETMVWEGNKKVRYSSYFKQLKP